MRNETLIHKFIKPRYEASEKRDQRLRSIINETITRDLILSVHFSPQVVYLSQDLSLESDEINYIQRHNIGLEESEDGYQLVTQNRSSFFQDGARIGTYVGTFAAKNFEKLAQQYPKLGAEYCYSLFSHYAKHGIPLKKPFQVSLASYIEKIDSSMYLFLTPKNQIERVSKKLQSNADIFCLRAAKFCEGNIKPFAAIHFNLGPEAVSKMKTKNKKIKEAANLRFEKNPFFDQDDFSLSRYINLLLITSDINNSEATHP